MNISLVQKLGRKGSEIWLRTGRFAPLDDMVARVCKRAAENQLMVKACGIRWSCIMVKTGICKRKIKKNLQKNQKCKTDR